MSANEGAASFGLGHSVSLAEDLMYVLLQIWQELDGCMRQVRDVDLYVWVPVSAGSCSTRTLSRTQAETAAVD